MIKTSDTIVKTLQKTNMSSENDIEEDILEQIDEESLEAEEKVQEYVDVGQVGKGCGKDEKELNNDNKNKKHMESTSVDELDEDMFNSNTNTEVYSTKRIAKLNTDNVDAKTIAIINYSSLLAKNVLQEALLLNEIYKRDSINISAPTDADELDRDKRIRQHLFPNENGRIYNKEDETCYDNYLIDKLLLSEADPKEGAETEGFDGKEEHFMSDKGDTYRGLERDDEYVKKADLDNTNIDREFSDKNNNIDNAVLGLVDVLDEGALHTIHEDAELVIDADFSDTDQEQTLCDREDVVSDVGFSVDNQKWNNGRQESTEARLPVSHNVLIDQNELPNTGDSTEKQDIGYARVNDESKHEEARLLLYEIDEEDIEDNDAEPDCCEMTFKQKKAMVTAVRKGDICVLETLLERKNADMAMKWFGETLLMVAIRAEQEDVAKFLIDNGIPLQYERKLVEVVQNGAISVHKITAREMAFDSEMDDLVELLDYKMHNLFPFVRHKHRSPILRQPIAPFTPPPLDEAIREEFLLNPEEAMQLQKKVAHLKRQRQREIEIANIQAIQRRRKCISLAENESIHSTKSKHAYSELNIINDEISQVFGPDEGYGTMSPVSPHRHICHVPDSKEHVSIRATRSFHLKKAFIASKANNLKRQDSSDYPMYQNNLIESIGSYSFESRKWHQSRSAPHYRNHSVDSLQAQSVHVGLPFVHGEINKVKSACSTGRNVSQRRSKSAHENISPYSQVAKLLGESRFFSRVSSSRSSTSTPHFPTISNNKTHVSPSTNTKINYIYADRSSAKAKHCELASLRAELLPTRKLRC